MRGVDEPYALPDPEPPPHLEALRQEAFRRAQELAAARPGEQALRRAVEAFVEHNHELAEAQATREGLSTDQVEELTYLGMLTQHTQRWQEVEELLGHPLDQAARAQAESLMNDMNADFKRDMRQLVHDGASEDARWQLIRDTEARYKQRYFELTGMNETLLDDLLAGDLSRKYPPTRSAEPADVPDSLEGSNDPGASSPVAPPRPERAPVRE